MSAFKTFTFGEGDNNVGKGKKRYKGEAGRTDRLSLVWFDVIEQNGTLSLDIKGDMEKNSMGQMEESGKKPKFVGCERVYIDKVGYLVANHPEIVKLAGKDPKTAIGTIVIKWPTNQKGELSVERLKEGEYEVLPWIFSEDKYNLLSPLQEEYPFNLHDIAATCTDSQFQKMSFTPKKNNMFRAFEAQAAQTDKPGAEKAKAIVEEILAEIQRVAANMNTHLAREMTVEQVRAKMSGGDVANAASAIGDAAAMADIDGLVDSILDD